ncbi:hypothetical protein OKW48_001182 [Paraburkholderia youngii]
MLETGTIERFASAGNFASYARCVDSQRMSNGKKKKRGQYQEWKSIPVLGIHRSSQLRDAL